VAESIPVWMPGRLPPFENWTSRRIAPLLVRSQTELTWRSRRPEWSGRKATRLPSSATGPNAFRILKRKLPVTASRPTMRSAPVSPARSVPARDQKR
jgi:hypothetical protein